MSFDPAQIQLRLAGQQDCSTLFEWRNTEEIRRYSFNPFQVDWDRHVEWFNDVLDRNDVILLIGEYLNESIGMLRFEIQDNVATVSIIVSPQWQGCGFAKTMLNKGEKWLEENISEVKEIRAYVKASNATSHNLFKGQNYTHYYTTYSKELYT